MGYSTEIKAVLGIDTSKMPEDTRKVLEQFKRAAKEIEGETARAGASSGEKFSHGFGSKLANSRYLGHTLATALGLNLPDLATKIASAITGGSAEGWKKSVEIAERQAEVIEKIIEAHMNPAQIAAKQRKDLTRAIDESKQGSVSGITAKRMAVTGALGLPGLDNLLAAIGIGQTQAEIAEATAKKALAVDEADLKVTLSKKDESEKLKKLEDDALAIRERSGTLAEKEKAIREHINALLLSMARDDLTEVEMKMKANELAQKQVDLQENLKAQKKESLELEKADLAIAEKRNELAHQRRDLEKDEAKLTDRGKLTVGELAQLKGGPEGDEERRRRREEEDRQRAFGGFGADVGLSSAAVDAREKAIQIKRLEEDAEAARLGGDSQKSLDLLGQVGTLRESLVKSGFTKSTEGDPARELRDQIKKDNETIIKTLNDIAETEKGRYTNQ